VFRSASARELSFCIKKMITAIVVTYLMQFTSDSSSADGNNNEVASSIGPIRSLSQPSSTAQHKVGNSLL